MAYDVTEFHAYYRAALSALVYLERARPSGRRFGPEADACWAAVAGGLGAGDRIDLLLRDADAEWPGALGARAVFGLPHVAEDDAFGRDWPGLEAVLADRFFREATASPASDITAALRSMALAWGLALTDVPVPAIDPRARYVVAGPSALASLSSAFASAPEARWADQVLTIAEAPVARQLAAAVPALLGQPGTSTILRAREALPPRFPSAHVLVSADASTEESTSASRARAT